MLIESTAHLPISLAMLQGVFNAPEGDELWRILLRWLHFVAGITWIGLLYFFNLVNVPVQKGLDAEKNDRVQDPDEQYVPDVDVATAERVCVSDVGRQDVHRVISQTN